MASEDYIKLVEARARQELEQLSFAQQRAIIEAYNTAGKELARKYQTTKGPATKALYASYTRKIATETQSIVEKYAVEGAKVAPSVERLIMQQAFQMAGLDTSLANDKFENMVGKLGMESVKNVIGGGIYRDGAGLSMRIWQSSVAASNQIQEVIAAGLAQDMSAVKLSRLLQDYVNPQVRRTWDNDKIKVVLGEGYAAWNKNLEYNALRLARTTLSHTATMSMRQAKRINPYLTKIRWHSVHAAGRTCPICEEMDGKVFPTEECPFDHPNGLCYQTHEMDKSLDEIADELANWCRGEQNDVLDSWWEGLTGEKPTSSLMDNLLHRLITREELKDMAESHICNTEPSFSDIFEMVSRGDITTQEASTLLRAHSEIYNGYIRTTNSFSINQYLRELPDGANITNYVDTINALDYAISHFEFQSDVKLRRFVASDYLDGTFGTSESREISKQIGSVFRNKQFMSTTIDSNPFFEDRPAIMTILCDKGTRAFPTTNYEEGEIILGRGTSYELIDVVDHTQGSPMMLDYEVDGSKKTFEYRGIELVVKILR